MSGYFSSVWRFARQNSIPCTLGMVILLFEGYKLTKGITPFAPLSIEPRFDAILYLVGSVLYLLFALSLIVPRRDYYRFFRTLVVVAIPSLMAGLLVLFWLYPKLVDTWALEDGPVEYLSALTIFTAALIWLVYGVTRIKSRQWAVMLVSFATALVFFLIGGEEISWGQRIFGIESSQFFLQNNMQKEMNFHNLQTFIFETVFYGAAAIALVIVPFWRDRLAKLLSKAKAKWLNDFLPSAWIAVPFVAILGFLPVVKRSPALVLIASAFCVAIVIYWGVRAATARKYWQVFGYSALLLLFVAAGMTFRLFAYGQFGVRAHVATEYLELFIEAGLLIYTIDFMFRKSRIYK